jgi:hypothetical protein
MKMESAGDLQRKLQSAVDGMLSKIDKSKLRPMQRKTYLRMADCFNDVNANEGHIQSCLQNSVGPVEVNIVC